MHTYCKRKAVRMLYMLECSRPFKGGARGKVHVRHCAQELGAEAALTFPAYVACVDVPLTKMASFTRLHVRGAVSSQGRHNQQHNQPSKELFGCVFITCTCVLVRRAHVQTQESRAIWTQTGKLQCTF